MTCIAAVQHAGVVFMAADTVATNDTRRWFQIHKIVCKPVGRRVALLGFAGQASLHNLLAHELDITRGPKGTSEDAYDRWAHEVACGITELARDARPAITDRESGHIAGTGLLAYAGRLWSVDSNAADRSPTFEAIGSGEAYALGALHALTGTGMVRRNPRRAVITAVEAATRWDNRCGGTIDIHEVNG